MRRKEKKVEVWRKREKERGGGRESGMEDEKGGRRKERKGREME